MFRTKLNEEEYLREIRSLNSLLKWNKEEHSR